MNSYNNYTDYKNIIAPPSIDTLIVINELIDSSGADIRRYNINRISGNNNVFCVNLKNLRNWTSVLIFTLNKKLLVIGTNTNKA